MKRKAVWLIVLAAIIVALLRETGTFEFEVDVDAGEQNAEEK